MGDQSVASAIQTASTWPFVPVLARMALAIAIGFFVGLERAHAGKAGVRTFSLTALLGCLAGLSGDLMIGVVMGLVAITVVLMNWRRMTTEGNLSLTTSVAADCRGRLGAVLCGKGHVFTPVAG